MSTSLHRNEKTFLITYEQAAWGGYYIARIYVRRAKKEHTLNLRSKVCLLISQNEIKVRSVLWSVLCEEELVINRNQAQT